VNFDLRAAVTSWVAQELELQCPGEDIGYWVTLEGEGTALPRVNITLATPSGGTMVQSWAWPPAERGKEGIRAAVDKGIKSMRADRSLL
jgi:hypothetical protein